MAFCGTTLAMHRQAMSLTPTHVDGIGCIDAGSAIYDDFYMTSSPERLLNVPDAWDWDTIMWATFEGNLTAGNLQYMLETINALRIKRRKKGDGKWLTMFEIPVSTLDDLTFVRYDRYVQADEDYEYALVPVVNFVEAELISHPVHVQFDGVYITDGDTSYHTRVECAIESYQRNHGGASVETLERRYPYYVRNASSNYDSGKAQGVFVPMAKDGCHMELKGTFNFRQEVLNFLLNGRAKILKDQFGQIWMIHVVDSPSVDGKGYPLIKLIAFDWVEIGDVNDQRDLYDNGFIAVAPHITGAATASASLARARRR